MSSATSSQTGQPETSARGVLLPCDRPDAASLIALEAPPRVDTFDDCLFIPMNHHYPDDAAAWGVFGRDRRLLPGTGYARGPVPDLVLQRQTTALDVSDVPDWAEDDCYVYGGMVQDHYGHFLTGAFARFWNWTQLSGRRLRILCHSYEDPASFFTHPYIAALFGHLGLAPGDFVRPTTPLRVRRLVVPHPSFEELHLVHRAFAVLCHRVGRELAPAEPLADQPPVYLTKQNVDRGLHTIVNEDEMTAVLERHGVVVASPERLDLAAQVALFSDDRLLAGFAGSAFHTSIFRPNRRLLIVDYDNHVRGNFALIDAINANRATYLHPGTSLQRLAGDGRFVNRMRIAEPRTMAEDLLRHIDDEGTRTRPTARPAATPAATPAARSAEQPARRTIPAPYAGLTRLLLAERIARHGWTVGDHSYGLPLVLEEEWGPLVIGRFCSIASATLILANHATDRATTYPFDTLGAWWPGSPPGLRSHVGAGVAIGSDVWLGHQSIILPGSRIGHGAIVGAGAVVRGHVPDYAVVAGNPAVPVRHRFDPPTVARLLARPWWDLPDETIDGLVPLLADRSVEALLQRLEADPPP